MTERATPPARPKFGLNRWDWSSPWAFAADVRRAEDLGWDYAFTGVNPIGAMDPYINLSMAALATNRIGLGPLLENAVLDHPASTASSVATLDAISGGRALLGYGIGDTAVRWLNQRPATVSEMEEATLLVRRLLTGEPVDVGARQPAVMRHARPVPVWLAAGGSRTLRMAGGTADGVFLRVGRHPANLQQAVAQVHAGARAAGRDPDSIGIGLIFHTIAPDSPSQIGAISRSMAAGYYEYSPGLFESAGLAWNGPPIEELKSQIYPDFHHAPDLVRAGELVSFLSDDVAGYFSLFGSAEDIAAQISDTLRLGFRVDIIVPHPVPMPVPGSAVPRAVPTRLAGADYKTWFAAEVVPRVRGR
jgi:alkanesulfonate monooxygenase SsuD/methylene tetrahydromethanopterin reductase-like flavin-dependent oxidoreductase (luciferase family)